MPAALYIVSYHCIGIKLYRTAPGSKGGESETELVVSSTAQGPAKNAIKIDVLLTDSDNSGRLKLYFLLTVGRHYVEGTSYHAAV